MNFDAAGRGHEAAEFVAAGLLAEHLQRVPFTRLPAI